ncbi:hypothetical protein M0R72_06540 [Candidatus Pacearchaeota archaeon]|jgi:hypothetical protein|nr:hypothetical protein [Candidatus Pacearchaeota archaeon]
MRPNEFTRGFDAGLAASRANTKEILDEKDRTISDLRSRLAAETKRADEAEV